MRLIIAALLALALPAHGDEVTVFGAASLKTALDGVAAEYQAATGDTVTLVYAGTPALARQIIAGAPADLFISASPDWMDRVVATGLVRGDGPQDLLRNRLVLVEHGAGRPALNDVPADFAARLGGGRLAMALVDAVPAGVYGKQALTSRGLWDALAPHVAQTDDARAALALVASGAAPFGIVYASDAVAEPRVTAVFTFPPDSHDPIIYPVARLSDSAAAIRFAKALRSEQAVAIFQKNGFTMAH